MNSEKIDLIIHPVRLRILQALVAESLTTQEISDRLTDVPTSSIYRHLKLLLENDLVAVAETNLVKGIEEKRYQISSSPRLMDEDMAGANAEDHLRFFTTYVLTLLRDFGNYLAATEAAHDSISLERDRTGYSDVTFYATPKELDGLQTVLNQALLPFLQQKPGNGRHRHKLAVISHPLRTQERKK